MAIYDDIMLTLHQRPGKKLCPHHVMRLLSTSSLIFKSKARQNYVSNLKINITTARSNIAAMLKSKSSTRWYASYRINEIESDDDVVTIYKWTKILYYSFLNLDSLDIDGHLVLTLNNLPRFYKVLGR